MKWEKLVKKEARREQQRAAYTDLYLRLKSKTRMVMTFKRYRDIMRALKELEILKGGGPKLF